MTINLDTRVILKLTWRGKHAVSSREQAWQKVHLLKEPYYKNDVHTTQKKLTPSFHSTLIFAVFLAQSVGCPYGWANQATQTILKIVSWNEFKIKKCACKATNNQKLSNLGAYPKWAPESGDVVIYLAHNLVTMGTWWVKTASKHFLGQ